MLNNTIALLSLILFSAISFAAEKEEIGKCAAKKTDAERLICYDNNAKNLGVDKPQTSVTAGKGKWIVRTDKSPINDTTNVYLSLDAEQSVRSGRDTVTPTLSIRCAEGKTSAYISWDLYLGLKSTSMLTRLDKKPAVTKAWSISTDNKAVFVSGGDVAFAKQLMSHHTLLAQITPYSQSPVMATFDIGGLSEAIKPLREACKWPAPTPAGKRNDDALIDAVRDGKREVVERLLSKGADVNAKDFIGYYTALMWAAHGGEREIAELLLSKGADINAKNSDGYTALIVAAILSDKRELVELLLSRGADINSKSSDGTTALLWAAAVDKREMANLLLSRGADVRAKSIDGKTVLMAAAQHGWRDMVELLLTKGVDVNSKDSNAYTALTWAVRGDLPETYAIVELLLAKGANVNAKTDAGTGGFSSLMIASENHQRNLVSLLLSKGADINATDRWGNTALIRVARNGQLEEVRLLIANGANVNAKDENGHPVLSRARSNVKEVLRRAGAKD